MNRQLLAKALFFLLTVFLFTGSARAGEEILIPIDQNRNVYTYVFSSCEGTTQFGESAVAFELFDVQLENEQSCKPTYARVTAAQHSVIDGEQLTASGSVTAEAQTSSNVHADGESRFSVTFQISRESLFTLTGIVSANATDGQTMVLGDASFTLVGPDTQLAGAVESGPDGEPQTLKIEESGLLAAGIYVLEVDAFAAVNNGLDQQGEAFFDLVLSLSTACLADLDEDGTVGAADLAILLGQWGEGDHPADFDGNGSVGAEDLAVLLGYWGACR